MAETRGLRSQRLELAWGTVRAVRHSGRSPELAHGAFHALWHAANEPLRELASGTDSAFARRLPDLVLKQAAEAHLARDLRLLILELPSGARGARDRSLLCRLAVAAGHTRSALARCPPHLVLVLTRRTRDTTAHRGSALVQTSRAGDTRGVARRGLEAPRRTIEARRTGGCALPRWPETAGGASTPLALRLPRRVLVAPRSTRVARARQRTESARVLAHVEGIACPASAPR